MFVPDCYKDQKMCDEAVNNYSHALRRYGTIAVYVVLHTFS